MKALKTFLADEQGATAVEYGLFVALIAAVIVALVQTTGTKVSSAFTTINSKLP
jgi:pilus assembly protein Flp/PilA